jgi:hypothetical protein
MTVIGTQETKSGPHFTSYDGRNVLIITVGFIIFTMFAIWGAVTFWNTAYVTGVKLSSSHPYLLSYFDWLNPAHVAMICMFGGIVAGCKFMWDIRHPAT